MPLIKRNEKRERPLPFLSFTNHSSLPFMVRRESVVFAWAGAEVGKIF
jgi:hypothetical protein